MKTEINTSNWVSYPFTVNGVNFISKLDPKGDFYPRVENLPNGVFLAYNQGAIRDLIGNPAEMTTDEINAKLYSANEFATQAVIQLA